MKIFFIQTMLSSFKKKTWFSNSVFEVHFCVSVLSSWPLNFWTEEWVTVGGKGKLWTPNTGGDVGGIALEHASFSKMLASNPTKQRAWHEEKKEYFRAGVAGSSSGIFQKIGRNTISYSKLVATCLENTLVPTVREVWSQVAFHVEARGGFELLCPIDPWTSWVLEDLLSCPSCQENKSLPFKKTLILKSPA